MIKIIFTNSATFGKYIILVFGACIKDESIAILPIYPYQISVIGCLNGLEFIEIISEKVFNKSERAKRKMDRLDVSKILFYAISITGILGLSFAFGLYSAAKKTVVYEAVRTVKNTVELVFEEITTMTTLRPEHFLQPARYEGAGVTVNDVSSGEEKLIFLSGFFDNNNELRLIRRNGTIIARWPVHFSEIFPNASHLKGPPKTDWNIDIHGALALPDGSVVFNFEYGGLVKLNRCGKVVWTLARTTHHSLELDESGGFWVPGKRYHSEESDPPFPPFKTPFWENTILKVSESGKVLMEISVPKLLYDNGLEALLTATGHTFHKNSNWAELRISNEIVHLNKIDILSSSIADDFPMFEAGDLAISMKYQNLVCVLDPDTGKIKWWKTGPWLRQHDPNFKPGGTITVFNNNMYRTEFGVNSGDRISISTPLISNILEIDPISNEYRILYGCKKGQEMSSIIRGKHKNTPNGGLLITEFEGGRVFETDAAGRIIWEYINRYDSDEVAEITEARIYPADYFKVSDWSCE